eukprot:GILI01024024.1.p1 GENE.GILI01024024.1~~GILI01024024.1.p1  ORF type:complete len:194 (+),score=25.77 GILI01024024.1:62-583(+)
MLLAAVGAMASCPTDVPYTIATIAANMKGYLENYYFTISLGSAVSVPPSGGAACSSPAYISQYTPARNCLNVWTQAFSVVQNGPLCVYTYTDESAGSIATVSLQCNAAATTLMVDPVVAFSSNSSNYIWAFTGIYYGVCDETASIAEVPKAKSVHAIRREKHLNGDEGSRKNE